MITETLRRNIPTMLARLGRNAIVLVSMSVVAVLPFVL